MQIDANMLQLLMETGYLACGGGMAAEAETIFDALRAARPESEYPLIGKAVLCLNKGANQEAVDMLRHQALKVNPESDIAKSFLGLALKLAGYQNDSRTVLAEVIDAGRDENAVQMAQSLLQEGSP